MIENSDIEGPADAGAGPGTARGHAVGAETGIGHVAAAEADGAAAPPSPGAPRGADAGTMAITFKLYATLQDLLPAGAVRNAVPIEIRTDASLNEVIDRFKVPRELAHLVLVNGVFVREADRDAPGALAAGDVLAIWPPVAGG